MRKAGIILCWFAALSLVPTLAQADPATPNTTQAATPTNDPNEIVCKQEPPKTGSRLGGGRVCATRREWERRMKDAQQATMWGEMKGMGGLSH